MLIPYCKYFSGMLGEGELLPGSVSGKNYLGKGVKCARLRPLLWPLQSTSRFGREMLGSSCYVAGLPPQPVYELPAPLDERQRFKGFKREAT